MSDWFIAWPDWKYRVEREGGLMKLSDEIRYSGGYSCCDVDELADRVANLEERIEALEEDRDTIAEWLSKALDRNADSTFLVESVNKVAKLESEIVQLKKDAAPFQAQIDQRKTYKAFDEQSQTE